MYMSRQKLKSIFATPYSPKPTPKSKLRPIIRTTMPVPRPAPRPKKRKPKPAPRPEKPFSTPKDYKPKQTAGAFDKYIKTPLKKHMSLYRHYLFGIQMCAVSFAT